MRKGELGEQKKKGIGDVLASFGWRPHSVYHVPDKAQEGMKEMTAKGDDWPVANDKDGCGGGDKRCGGRLKLTRVQMG